MNLKLLRTCTWTLRLELPDGRSILVAELDPAARDTANSVVVDGFVVGWSIETTADYAILRATAQLAGESATDAAEPATRKCFLSLQASYEHGDPWNFNGSVSADEIYRQSPHDVDAWIVDSIARQSVPMIALQSGEGFAVAVCGSPARYDNYTSQEFAVSAKRLTLSSGDTGRTPGLQPGTLPGVTQNYNVEKTQRFTPGKVESHYHTIGGEANHQFEALIFTTASDNLVGLRQSTNNAVAQHFSGGKYTSGFGALAYSTAFLNLRRNETRKSRVWVVPSIEYSNTQYCRDAFWIATMLSPEDDFECLKSELAVVNHFAEYPLFVLIWAWRIEHRGIAQKLSADRAQLQAYLDLIENRTRDGWYHSYDENAGRHDFQYWADQWAFTVDDTITYNQGLLVLALRAAEKLGLATRTSPESALANYRSLFNKKEGFYPISRLKNTVFGPDPVLPDTVSQLYFDGPLLDSSSVRSHFRAMNERNKTAFGFRNLCAADGSAPPNSWYDIPGYTAQANKEDYGDYAYLRGGSWLLYDGIFLLGAFLHGETGALDLFLWRIGLDFAAGGTTFEYLNTLTGAPHKPNMGWNIALYAFVEQLTASGRMDSGVRAALDALGTR